MKQYYLCDFHAGRITLYAHQITRLQDLIIIAINDVESPLWEKRLSRLNSMKQSVQLKCAILVEGLAVYVNAAREAENEK